MLEKDFITITSLFEDSGLDTMTLNGMGFVVIRPVGAGNNSNIDYNKETYNTIGFTKKPIIPTYEEMRKNSRSKSAKLRAAEKR